MVDPFKAFPEPHAVKLRRICVAQVASTAVLLSCLTIVVNKL